MRRFVNGLLDDAAGRLLFEAGAIEALRNDFFEGYLDNLAPIAAMIGFELWR